MFSKIDANRLRRCMAAISLALAASAPLSAIAAQQNGERASFTADTAATLRKTPAQDRTPSAHVQRRALTPSQRAPRVEVPDSIRRGSYDDASHPASRSHAESFDAVTASVTTLTCNDSQFASLSGTALVNAVKAADVTCINDLFNLTGSTATNTFREAQMVTIANAFNTAAASYDGTNSGSLLQLVLYLRAGYYVQYYNPALIGSYGTALKSAIEPAMDRFVASGSFGLVNDVHGQTLSEFVTLIDSSGENARYLYVVKRLLANYTSAWNPYYWMRAAVNNGYVVLFRGQYQTDYVAAIQVDTSIIDSLYNFAINNFSQLGGDYDYLASNAGRELGRFLQYGGAAQSLARTRAKDLINRSSVTGTSASIWVGVGEMVTEYDAANCSYYGICDFAQRLATNVLPITYQCSSTLRLRAQALTQAQITDTCAKVAGEETYFHQKVNSHNTPVANDYNTTLEMVVFHSSTDYATYSGAIFGNDTNNGGIYLEGDPSVQGNQPRFIAYEAEWMRPTFEIWNLTHEYIHYLDGRFDMYGDFGDATSVVSIWWIEGFAEYMSYSYRNLAYTDAMNQAAAATYTLSHVFANDYNSGQTLVYNWGYLAVRFMFEKHLADVNAMLADFRPGNYAAYTTLMNGINTRYDAEFRSWLPCVANPNGTGCGGTANVPPVANFSFAANGLAVSFTDASSDSDGSIASRSWTFGDGTTSTATSPGKTYSAAGTYSVKLTVTDNAGASTSATKSVTVTAAPSTTVLTNGVPVANVSGALNSERLFTIAVPSGATNLKVTLAGGSGDADLFVKFGSAPAGSTGDCTSTGSTTAESCTIAAPQVGTYYIKVLGYSAYSGVTVTASYTAGTSLPECTATRTDELGKNCKRSNFAANAGGYSYFYINIPAGTTQLRITASGGTGDANLYYNASTWATTTAYLQRSTNSGNGESIVVTNPPAGYVYISLYGNTAYSGVQVSTQY